MDSTDGAPHGAVERARGPPGACVVPLRLPVRVAGIDDPLTG